LQLRHVTVGANEDAIVVLSNASVDLFDVNALGITALRVIDGVAIVRDSVLEGVETSIFVDAAIVEVATTRIRGGAITVEGGGHLRCVYLYDLLLDPLDCPPTP
jgi:hypothetical protein